MTALIAPGSLWLFSVIAITCLPNDGSPRASWPRTSCCSSKALWSIPDLRLSCIGSSLKTDMLVEDCGDRAGPAAGMSQDRRA